MNLHFLSLSSGSDGNCYYIGTECYGILIDAGISPRCIKKGLAAAGLSLDAVVALCLTHDHADHVKSAGYIGERLGIPVYATREILDGANRCRCISERIYSSGHPISKETPFAIRDFLLTAFEVPHDGSDNVGYMVECGDRCFVFATDLGQVPDRAAAYLQRAHCLIIEANYDAELLQSGSYPPYLKRRIASPTGHLCNADTAEFLATHYTPRLEYIFLCHLSRENNRPERAYDTVAARLSQAGIAVGRDVQLVALERHAPSALYTFPLPDSLLP